MRQLTSEEGSVLVIVAFSLTALLVLAGLVVDVGYVYLQRTLLQNTVDAAALAGVQELPDYPEGARYQASQYAEYNLVGLANLGTLVEEQNMRIAVTAEKDVDLFFLKIIGRDRVRVGAKAAAQVGTVTGFRKVAPLGVVDDQFEPGQSYYLKLGPGVEGGSYQGNFGALALGDTGASIYEENLKQGYKGFIRIGDEIPTEPGNMAGPTIRGVDYRLTQPHDCEWQTAGVNCPRVVIVPVIDSLDVPGRKTVTVVGFAAFYLEDTANDNDTYIKGKFVEMVVDGESGPANNYGLRSYRLVE